MTPKIKFLVIAAAAALALRLAADTEWIVTPIFSGSGRMLLHANRGTATGKVPPVWMSYDPAGKGTYGFLRIGNKGGMCFAGINEKGLAAAYTTGDPTDDPLPPQSNRNWSGHTAVVTSLRSAATADGARSLLHKAFKDKLINGTMVVFFADPRKAVIVECSPRHYASWDLKDSYCVYSHMWKLPGMDDGSVRSTGSAEVCTMREWGVREGLRRVRTADGKIPVAGSLAVSRLNTADLNTEEYQKQRGKSPVQYAPYNQNAQDSYLFELDAEFPEFLSRVYIAFGPARHTVYLPIALPALKDLPGEILDPDYFQGAMNRHNAAAPEAPVNTAITEFEKKLHGEFEEQIDKARDLVTAGKTAEAEKLINDTAHRQAAETLEFLRGLK
jgi:hypothetical protein